MSSQAEKVLPVNLGRISTPPTNPRQSAADAVARIGATMRRATLTPVETGEIFAYPMPFLAPAVYVPVVSSADTGTRIAPSVIASNFAILGLTSYPVGNTQLTGISFLNAAGVGALGVHAAHGISYSATAILSTGFASLGPGVFGLSGDILTAVNVFLAGWRDYLGVGGQVLVANVAAQTFALGAGQISKNARRDVQDCGPSPGSENNGVRRALRWERSTGTSLYLRGGGGHFLFSLLGRVDLSWQRVLKRDMDVPLHQARELLFERNGFRKFCRDKARALGFVADPVDWPQLTEPERLPWRDTFHSSRSKLRILGLLGGNLGAWGGANLTTKRDIEIKVRRLDARQVATELTRVAAHATQLYAMSPFGPHLTWRTARAKAVRQSFIFNIAEPLERSIYLQTLKVPLPGRHLSHIETPSPPAATQLTRVHTLQARTQDIGGGLKWQFIPREMTPKGWEWGLTYHNQLSREQQSLACNAGTFFADLHSRSYFSERFIRGVKSVQVAATQHFHQHSTPDNAREKTFDSLVLECKIGDTNIGRSDFNRRFVKRLNRYFDTQISSAVRRHNHEVRHVRIERCLDAHDLAEFARHAAATDLAGTLKIANAADSARIKRSRVQPMGRRLAGAKTEKDRAQVLARFVGQYGLSAMAYVYHLGNKRIGRLTLSTASSTYTETEAKASTLVLRYQNNIEELNNKSARRAVKKALQRLANARADALDDPFLGASERNRLIETLNSLQRKLENLIMRHPRAAAAR